MEDPAFLNDVPPLLALGVSFDPAVVCARVQEAVLSRLPAGTSRRKKDRRRQ